MLIVAPKSMVPEWPNDFTRFMSDRYDVQVVSGSRAEKRRILTSDADVLVTNFETTVSMEAELRSVLNRHRERAILVVDESFYAKNLDVKRTIALRRLREWCGRAFVLCGTPAPNAPHDLIQQFNLVDFGLTFAEVDVPDDRDAARPVIQRLINERGLYVRHQKKVVLPDLPSKTFNRVYVPLQPQQAKLYESALNNLIIDLRNVDDSTFQKEIVSFLARRSVLLQICSNPAAVTTGYAETPAKLLAIDELLTDAIERRHEKVIIWSFYTGSVEAAVDRYQRYNPVRYDGTVSDVAERRAAVKRFQADDETMLFVANPAAAGAGLTLHRARFAIYEPEPSRYTKSMSVDGQDLPLQRVQQDTFCRLGPDAREVGQVAKSLIIRHLHQRVERDPSEVRECLPQNRLYPRPLLAAQARVLNDGPEALQRQPQDPVPVPPHLQSVEDSVEAVMSCHLRQDDEHQLIKGVILVRVMRTAVSDV